MLQYASTCTKLLLCIWIVQSITREKPYETRQSIYINLVQNQTAHQDFNFDLITYTNKYIPFAQVSIVLFNISF